MTRTKDRKERFSLKKNLSAYLIMLPALILFGFFVWEPLLKSIQISFYNTRGFTTYEFAGLKNYAEVLTDTDFVKALVNTFIYILWSLAVGFLTPIIMSMLLNEITAFKAFFRIGMYFPNVVPGMATVLMWGFLMTPGPGGALNAILGMFGMAPLNWLENPTWTIALIVMTMTWKGAGSTALIYLARLQGINQDLYEAAAIDGAGIWKRTLHVTVPNLYSTGKTLLILQIISVFQVLYEPLVMTHGGPNKASISLMQLNYKYAFEDITAAKAAALGVVICIILIILTTAYNLVSRRESDY